MGICYLDHLNKSKISMLIGFRSSSSNVYSNLEIAHKCSEESSFSEVFAV